MELLNVFVVLLIKRVFRYTRSSCTVFVLSRMMINFLRMYKHHYRAKYLKSITEETLNNIFEAGKWAGRCKKPFKRILDIIKYGIYSRV